ncbi:hypothetical protein NLI96_g3628 [Meripilus lineatus]|uniref:Uncharacterized protein n=1 Tax=Meripilus lineatus TaxID=2056292 RepID=A0AAD5V6E5_9APHY|nr:hypothetical protein NLI96_g3628 [Physisporinus lineatus]
MVSLVLSTVTSISWAHPHVPRAVTSHVDSTNVAEHELRFNHDFDLLTGMIGSLSYEHVKYGIDGTASNRVGIGAQKLDDQGP